MAVSPGESWRLRSTPFGSMPHTRSCNLSRGGLPSCRCHIVTLSSSRAGRAWVASMPWLPSEHTQAGAHSLASTVLGTWRHRKKEVPIAKQHAAYTPCRITQGEAAAAPACSLARVACHVRLTTCAPIPKAVLGCYRLLPPGAGYSKPKKRVECTMSVPCVCAQAPPPLAPTKSG